MVAPPPLIERIDPDGHPLLTLENLYRAYLRCRRRKRTSHNAMRFEADLEANLMRLRDELNSGSYRPGPSLAFMVEKPKRREIFAADFRDRIVHHLLVGHLTPGWERRFIDDSYACRMGKGTHRAVERLRSFCRKATANGTREAFYLQLDVRGFFVTLDRNILYEMLAAREPDPVVRWLIGVILFDEPTRHCRFRRTRRSDFERLPAHKTLFRANPGCGLPIGNLTSQFFANVYLDRLDQFVKHELKARFYLRYADDMVFVAAKREPLTEWRDRVEEFLDRRLRLRLNPKERLRPVGDGIDFLGYVVRPAYVLVRRRVVGGFRERLIKAETALREAGLSMDSAERPVYPWPWAILMDLRRSLSSYLAHLEKASSRRLVESLQRRFRWLTEYFRRHGSKVDFVCPTPGGALRYRAQVEHFRRCLPGHVLVLRLGAFVEVVPPGNSDQRVVRVPRSRIENLRRRLWYGDAPVAWIDETGRRIGRINERALVRRWGERRASLTGIRPPATEAVDRIGGP